MPVKESFACSSNDRVHRMIAGSAFVQRRVVSLLCHFVLTQWKNGRRLASCGETNMLQTRCRIFAWTKG